MNNAIIVWTEVPASDMNRAVAFYNKVFVWNMEITTQGLFPMAVFGNDMSDASGHLYPGTPGKAAISHFRLPDALEAGIERVRAAGGTLVGEPVVQPFGRFQYVTDTEGNSIGIFEPKAA